MKFILLSLIAAAVLGCVWSCSDAEFADFKTKFGKEYANEKENNLRKEIFCANLKKIQAHNSQYEKGQSSYTQGVNQFSDMTPEEFQNSGYVMHHGGLRKP